MHAPNDHDPQALRSGRPGPGPAPWAERVLLPICATALIGGWLAFQGLVVWVVLTLDQIEVYPQPERLHRITLEPAVPIAGQPVSIHYDWSGIDPRYDVARLALVNLPAGKSDGRQPEYVRFRRGEVAQWKIPDDAASITIIGLKPRDATHTLNRDLVVRGR